jgi:hypothetical protein
MFHFSIPSVSLAAAALLALAPSPAVGQEIPAGPWLVTTASSMSPVIGLIDSGDSAMVRVEADVTPYVHTSAAGWFALTGFEPGDIDGFALRILEFSGLERSSIAFSLLSNEGAFRDGDVLGFAMGGGVNVLVSEDALLGILGTPSANIDVDAIAYDESGRLHFSIQSFLAGTVLGDVDNGDVLRLEPDGTLTRVVTEADVELALFVATGLTDPIGDVHGVEVIGGDIYVAVQGPSGVDGTPLRVGPNAALVAAELKLGLIGEEIDGMAYMGSTPIAPSITVDSAVANPGAFIHGEAHGFAPGAPVMILTAGNPGFSTDYGLGGFGDLFLDPTDPWLNAALSTSGVPIIAADGTGSFSVDFFLPPTEMGALWMGSMGWSIQAVDLSNMSISAPIRIQVL